MYAKTLGFCGVLLAAGLLCAGCPNPASLFNPTFIQAIVGGEQAANLPGDAPAIVLEVENGTQRVVEYRLTWRDGNGTISERVGSLAVGGKYSEAVICPVQEVTLGDVSSLQATSAIVRLGEGGIDDPFVVVEPFGVLLQDGVNYDCGDGVTFKVLPSQATQSGYQVFAFIRRAGTSSNTATP